tara:strand:- start:1887 stop:2066 length:180 start_codon:yes stop_codon:yes gene_type:complete
MRFAITIQVETSASKPDLMTEIDNELEYFLHAVGCELGDKVVLKENAFGMGVTVEEISK